jgi:hypothetical protein
MIKPRRLEGEGNVARTGENRYAYRIWVEKSEEKRPLGRPRCRQEDNIMAVKKRHRMGWYGLD